MRWHGQAQGSTTTSGPDIASVGPTRVVPSGARKQAEDAVKQGLANPDSVTFRAEKVNVIASIKHDAFSAPVDGPISLVCGQYSSRDEKGVVSDYAWFLVTIKRGHVLWTNSDEPSDSEGAAYGTCKAAGLASRFRSA
ncbi:MAG: hypothetical protein WDM85_17890 [Caulobacteraceae bacterium]